jgi:endonuclease G
LSWNGSLGRANWLSWQLSETDLGDAPRDVRFRGDPDAPMLENPLYKEKRAEQIAQHAGPALGAPIVASEYTGSGYDRGHLCPPGDRRGSIKDQAAVFLMSNVVPQSPVRNRDLWMGLEKYCRDLAGQGWQLFITAGPAGNAEVISLGRITVPALLWKIVLALPRGATLKDATAKARVIAIRMTNAQQKRIDDWRDARVTVRSLEDELGFIFFDQLGEFSETLKRRIEPD